MCCTEDLDPFCLSCALSGLKVGLRKLFLMGLEGAQLGQRPCKDGTNERLQIHTALQRLRWRFDAAKLWRCKAWPACSLCSCCPEQHRRLSRNVAKSLRRGPMARLGCSCLLRSSYWHHQHHHRLRQTEICPSRCSRRRAHLPVFHS
jgi:hypothetical protein